DAFKQPISIILVVSVLLYMDWKFTLATLVLFPSCIVPIRIFGRRARQAVKNQQENMGQMVVTMQETFAGIRVVKAFAREAHQVKTLSKMHIVMQRSVAATVGIFGILDTPSAIQNSPEAQSLDSCDGRINFQNVTFRYAGTSTDALKDLNLQIEPGKSYALVG